MSDKLRYPVCIYPGLRDGLDIMIDIFTYVISELRICQLSSSRLHISLIHRPTEINRCLTHIG